MITVYVLRSVGSGKRYVGITGKLFRRLTEHRNRASTVGKLLGTFEVLETEEFADYAQARQREKFLKSGQGRKALGQKYPR